MRYYLLVSPAEALIASMLESREFGAYMATGSRKTASEELIFAEITSEFESDFDWEYARSACVPHPDGTPKHSVYLGVYRVLERVPLDVLGNLYLVTRDGRSLELAKGHLEPPLYWKGYALYKELCPVTPLVASSLPPEPFARYLLDPANHISVPAIVFADVKIIDLDNLEHTGNVGALYDHGGNEHIRICFEEIQSHPGKRSKTVDRSCSNRFSYQSVGQGFFFSRRADGIVFYPMLDREVIRKDHYEWGRSAGFY